MGEPLTQVLGDSVAEYPIEWILILLGVMVLPNIPIRIIVTYFVGQANEGRGRILILEPKRKMKLLWKATKVSLVGVPKKTDEYGRLFLPVVQGGPLVGAIERGLVFVLSLMGEFSAVGFVMAAKALVAEDLRPWRHVAHVEKERDPETGIMREAYILGTLLSFLLAVLAGIAMRYRIGG